MLETDARFKRGASEEKNFMGNRGRKPDHPPPVKTVRRIPGE